MRRGRIFPSLDLVAKERQVKWAQKWWTFWKSFTSILTDRAIMVNVHMDEKWFYKRTNVKELPVSILNERALVKMKHGINFKEHAHFVHLISNCKKFKLEANKDAKNKKQFHVITTFDGHHVFRFIYL